jgi:superfamily II DNA/RNA helicase
MRASLSRWIGDADALRHLEYFRLTQPSLQLSHIRSRSDDYYISLVGELFDAMRFTNIVPADWARLGNALSQFAQRDQELFPEALGVSRSEAALFSACAFYFGGFPASAYLTIINQEPAEFDNEAHRACFDLLRRPSAMRSEIGSTLLGALRLGNLLQIQDILERASASSRDALLLGPNEWIPSRLFEQLMHRFVATNVRAILPDGTNEFWTPFVSSLLDRTPATWEFFPSQIAALQRGLLERPETFSLQMPTGAGKTTLCETLLYWHARRSQDSVAVMLVPYRALAAELRNSMIKRLNALGISARCAYGGTVPTGDEVTDLNDVRVMVATPEALSGTLSADPDFFRRISLVICDEGHLLDSGERGVGLELLLARMRARSDGGPRAVFLSAIVPNIEEINAWLGGTPDSVVRSDYRPALAEFAVLRSTGENQSLEVALDMHAHESPPVRFVVSPFLRREDFRWLNPDTHRPNTYPFGSFKTQAIAAARKALPMGAAAVFAANKRGNQGAVGLAEELIKQLRSHLPLPEPATFTNVSRVLDVEQYLNDEYGPNWVGTQVVQFGAILHHGDVPQETREVLELLLRRGDLRLAICTSTLAEGVNLPIRTLVLYSVQRRSVNGSEALLTRDIKNLVGRAGRAGASTKGLVICANSGEWPIVEQVARQVPGEPVRGALRELVERVKDRLALQDITLTNQILETTVQYHTLIDGIDATLIDLAAEEIGEEELERLARELADKTFASQQAQLQASKNLLQEVFVLRARRIIGVRTAGRLQWIREGNAQNSVESSGSLVIHSTTPFSV